MADFLKGARGTVAGDFKNEITVAGSRKKRKKRGGGSGVEGREKGEEKYYYIGKIFLCTPTAESATVPACLSKCLPQFPMFPIVYK